MEMDDHSATSTRLWWQREALVPDIQLALAHVNTLRDRASHDPSGGWELDATRNAFDAANHLWDTLGKEPGNEHLADATETNRFKALLLAMPESSRIDLLGMPSVADIAEFEPLIFDHRTIRATQRFEEATPEKRERATQDHRHLKDSWTSWRHRGSQANQVLRDLSRTLLVVRNNLQHGGKTIGGPNMQMAERNHDVASTVLPVLRDILDLVLGCASMRLAVYGTLRTGEANHEVLADVGGERSPVILRGILGSRDGLPEFRFTDVGGDVAAELIQSPTLAEHWAELDEFEGARYARHLGVYWTDGTPGVANVYVSMRNPAFRRSALP